MRTLSASPTSSSSQGCGEPVAIGPGDPLGEHRQGAAGLLVLGKRLPLALNDRERGRMEGVDPSHAAAHSADSTSACSSTVCVAFFCLSGG